MSDIAPDMQRFIDENRAELIAHIQAAVPNHQIDTTDEAIEAWVLNDEPLYLWARSEGVDV